MFSRVLNLVRLSQQNANETRYIHVIMNVIAWQNYIDKGNQFYTVIKQKKTKCFEPI